MADVIGSEGLMDATSNAGVCPSSEPAANTIATLMNGNKPLGMAVSLVTKALSGIGAGERNRAAWAAANIPQGQLGHCTQPACGFSRK
jgi:hypothetical protein